MQSEGEVCPECGVISPATQIENMDMCERCAMDD